MVPWNSTPFGFAKIGQSKQTGINNPKNTEYPQQARIKAAVASVSK